MPVVEVDRETQYAGGAANVARNLREFTGHAAVLGMIGADPAGHTLKRLLTEDGIHVEGVQQDPQYQTILKTRIIARTSRWCAWTGKATCARRRRKSSGQSQSWKGCCRRWMR